MKKLFYKKITVKKDKLVKFIILFSALILWLSWDLYQTEEKTAFNYISYFPSSLSLSSQNKTTTVSIVRSDDNSLLHHDSRDTEPSDVIVEEMVRKAVDLAGGFKGKIHSGNTVLIKPNLVEPQASGSGNITDVRVVEAIVKMVDEIDHGNIKIIVGDGSARPFSKWEKEASKKTFIRTPWTELFGDHDPGKDPGYQILKNRMTAAGVDFRLSNLNGNSEIDPQKEIKEVDIPGGGQAQPQHGRYYVHKDVLDADVYISVPVMKIHDPGITCALKNQLGIAAGSIYGYSKIAGIPKDNYQHRLYHVKEAPYSWTDKEIVDFNKIAKVKFVVVDALMCLEIRKTLFDDKTNQIRMNTIIAGVDPVAVDHVCSKLMGLNPDDIEHITLAERIGTGTNDPDKIKIVGADIESTKKRFKRNPKVEDQKYGQGNREWIVNGPFAIGDEKDPLDYEYMSNENSLVPEPGKNGWSEELYFINDRINLGDYFKSYNSKLNNIIGYAFTYFYAPEDQDAELWIGSDEALKVYINGNEIYKFDGSRKFDNKSLVSDTKKIKIKKGINKLLVKTLQKNEGSFFDFSLNICAIESNPFFQGNRVVGLKFSSSKNNFE